jgi:hypothetical protein
MNYIMIQRKEFLTSTSRWTELHLIAFRCLLLENLHIGYILPEIDLPDDNDPIIQLVTKYLSDIEEDIRSGESLVTLGPATSFYQELQVVLKYPGNRSSPIPIPRKYRRSSLTIVLPIIPESSPISDSLYNPTPYTTISGPDISQYPRKSMDTSERWLNNTESTKSDHSSSDDSSTEEDKLEIIANQVVVSLLGLLCIFE